MLFHSGSQYKKTKQIPLTGFTRNPRNSQHFAWQVFGNRWRQVQYSANRLTSNRLSLSQIQPRQKAELLNLVEVSKRSDCLLKWGYWKWQAENVSVLHTLLLTATWLQISWQALKHLYCFIHQFLGIPKTFKELNLIICMTFFGLTEALWETEGTAGSPKYFKWLKSTKKEGLNGPVVLYLKAKLYKYKEIKTNRNMKVIFIRKITKRPAIT